MNEEYPTTLVLGATGRTGSRVAADLIDRGLPVRTAARSGADVDFDWSNRDSGAIIVPTGNGSEAFIAAEDIAAVAATTLAAPAAHAGAAYDLTGPEALTVSGVAAIISDATGQAIVHLNLDREAWIAGAIANGIPAEYGAVLRQLTETVASGNGSRPNDTVERVTGTPPRTFRDFARTHAAAWIGASK